MDNQSPSPEKYHYLYERWNTTQWEKREEVGEAASQRAYVISEDGKKIIHFHSTCRLDKDQGDGNEIAVSLAARWLKENKDWATKYLYLDDLDKTADWWIENLNKELLTVILENMELDEPEDYNLYASTSFINPNGITQYGVTGLITEQEYVDRFQKTEAKKEVFELKCGGTVEVDYVLLDGLLDRESMTLKYVG